MTSTVNDEELGGAVCVVPPHVTDCRNEPPHR